MSYPSTIDGFTEKLNKKRDGVYVIEEEVQIETGKWEGFLKHDNAIVESIQIFDGPKLSGKRITNYFVSIPEETSWKRYLKVFSNAEKVYITYETPGDQVEAEDINRLQETLTTTRLDFEDYKKHGRIDGGTF